MAVTIMSCASWRLRPGIDLAGDEVAADGLERRRPAAPAQAVALAQGLEPLVVADGMAVVLGHVVAEVDAQAGEGQAGGPPVVVDDERSRPGRCGSSASARGASP